MRYSGKFKKKYQLKRKLIFKKRVFCYLFLILTLFLISFYLICFSSFFQVKEVEISGNQKVPAQIIKNLIEEKLSQRILLFHSKSIFLTNLKELEKRLLSKFPQIKKVDFNRDLPNKLIVLIEERKPVAIFCQNKEYFFVDEEGIIFEEISEKGSWLVIRNSFLSRDIKLGEEIIEKKNLTQILKIKSELKNLGLGINSTEIINEQRVNASTSEGWEIYFDLQDKISQQIFNLSLVLKEKISSQERRNLEYIDLRFGNQIYYK